MYAHFIHLQNFTDMYIDMNIYDIYIYMNYMVKALHIHIYIYKYIYIYIHTFAVLYIYMSNRN